MIEIINKHLRHQLGNSIYVESTPEGLWLRYDTEDSDPKEQWSNYIEVVETLKLIGYEFDEPQVEHDCITGDIIKIKD